MTLTTDHRTIAKRASVSARRLRPVAIDPTKCRAGVPAPGGKPRQCPLAYTTTKILRPADKTGIEVVNLCAKHETELADRLVITLYRETTKGAVPIRAFFA